MVFIGRDWKPLTMSADCNSVAWKWVEHFRAEERQSPPQPADGAVQGPDPCGI